MRAGECGRREKKKGQGARRGRRLGNPGLPRRRSCGSRNRSAGPSRLGRAGRDCLNSVPVDLGVVARRDLRPVRVRDPAARARAEPAPRGGISIRAAPSRPRRPPYRLRIGHGGGSRLLRPERWRTRTCARSEPGAVIGRPAGKSRPRSKSASHDPRSASHDPRSVSHDPRSASHDRGPPITPPRRGGKPGGGGRSGVRGPARSAMAACLDRTWAATRTSRVRPGRQASRRTRAAASCRPERPPGRRTRVMARLRNSDPRAQPPASTRPPPPSGTRRVRFATAAEQAAVSVTAAGSAPPPAAEQDVPPFSPGRPAATVTGLPRQHGHGRRSRPSWPPLPHSHTLSL